LFSSCLAKHARGVISVCQWFSSLDCSTVLASRLWQDEAHSAKLKKSLIQLEKYWVESKCPNPWRVETAHQPHNRL
jgi:hypothetical protein